MHFFVHVILPDRIRGGCSQNEVESAIESVLKPYSVEDGENEDGWWDWYEMGGRFDGLVKPRIPLPPPPASGLLQRVFPPRAPANVAPM